MRAGGWPCNVLPETVSALRMRVTEPQGCSSGVSREGRCTAVATARRGDAERASGKNTNSGYVKHGALRDR